MSKTTRTRSRERSKGELSTYGYIPMGVALMTASTSRLSSLSQGTTWAATPRASARANNQDAATRQAQALRQNFHHCCGVGIPPHPSSPLHGDGVTGANAIGQGIDPVEGL